MHPCPDHLYTQSDCCHCQKAHTSNILKFRERSRVANVMVRTVEIGKEVTPNDWAQRTLNPTVLRRFEPFEHALKQTMGPKLDSKSEFASVASMANLVARCTGGNCDTAGSFVEAFVASKITFEVLTHE